MSGTISAVARLSASFACVTAMKQSQQSSLVLRLVSHFLTGMWLGTGFAVVLVLFSKGKLQRLVASTYGPVAGELDFIIGCALFIGLGATFTGLVLENAGVNEDV